MEGAVATAVPSQLPAAAAGAPQLVLGQSYTLTPVTNVTLESTGVALGVAAVTGTGLGVDGSSWLLGYYGGQWLVHNGSQGSQSTYVTYALVIPTVPPPLPVVAPTSTTTTPASTAPAAPAATTFGLTNGQLLVVGGAVVGAAALGALAFRRRRRRQMVYGDSVI